MGASNSERKNLKFYNLNGKVDATNDPSFGFSEKIDDKWKTTATFDQMTGVLVRGEIKEKEWEGAKYNVFYITLKDDHEESVVQMKHTQITHSIISSLCSLESFDKPLLIRLYKDSSQSNGKTYWNGKAYMEYNGVKVAWAINPKDAPKPEPVIKADGSAYLKDGKPVYDSSVKQKFYEDHFNAVMAKLAANPVNAAAAEAQAFLDEPNAHETAPEGDEPF